MCTLTFVTLLFSQRAELTTGAPNIRLQLGMFTVYPAVGTVPAGGSVQVTVDMIGENPGYCEEVSLQRIRGEKSNFVAEKLHHSVLNRSARTAITILG